MFQMSFSCYLRKSDLNDVPKQKKRNFFFDLMNSNDLDLFYSHIPNIQKGIGESGERQTS